MTAATQSIENWANVGAGGSSPLSEGGCRPTPHSLAAASAGEQHLQW
jgi:hypothetical protein